MKKFLETMLYIIYEWSMIFDGKDRVVFDVCNELTLYDCTIIARLHTIIDYIAEVQKLNFIAIKLKKIIQDTLFLKITENDHSRYSVFEYFCCCTTQLNKILNPHNHYYNNFLNMFGVIQLPNSTNLRSDEGNTTLKLSTFQLFHVAQISAESASED
jgi:hypothetical protein